MDEADEQQFAMPAKDLAGRQSPPKGSQVLGVPGLAASGFDMDTVMNPC